MGFGEILTWVIVGGLAGWVASKITKTDANLGLLGNIVAGIIGGLVGGFVFNLVGGAGFTGFNLWSFFVALIGAIITLTLWKSLSGRKA